MPSVAHGRIEAHPLDMDARARPSRVRGSGAAEWWADASPMPAVVCLSRNARRKSAALAWEHSSGARLIVEDWRQCSSAGVPWVIDPDEVGAPHLRPPLDTAK